MQNYNLFERLLNMLRAVNKTKVTVKSLIFNLGDVTMLDLIKKLIAPYKYCVKAYRPHGIFFPLTVKQIEIEEKDITETFENILNSLIKEFGKPCFVHSYYGFLFERGGNFVAYNIIEQTYCCETINIFIFKKMPSGKKIAYDVYSQVDTSIRKFTEKIGFPCPVGINHYNDNRFFYLLNNDKFQILIIIKKHTLTYYISKLTAEEMGIRVVPVYNGLVTINFTNESSLNYALKKIEDKLKAL